MVVERIVVFVVLDLIGLIDVVVVDMMEIVVIFLMNNVCFVLVVFVVGNVMVYVDVELKMSYWLMLIIV